MHWYVLGVMCPLFRSLQWVRVAMSTSLGLTTQASVRCAVGRPSASVSVVHGSATQPAPRKDATRHIC